MREIKFRAWDISNKKMLIQKEKYNDFEDLTNFLQFEVWDLLDCDEDKKNIILMQFTGLKDKNGKEIYEGDIVEIKEETHKRLQGFKGQKYKVIFNEGSFEIKREINIGIEQNNLGTVNSYICLEIIGNIYENPELLEEKQK